MTDGTCCTCAPLGLQTATDKAVLQTARDNGRILVSADTDFGALLAASHEPGPSVVLVRRVVGRRMDALAGPLIANLPQVEVDLRLGSIVAIGDDSVRARRLPSIEGVRPHPGVDLRSAALPGPSAAG